MIGGTVTSGDVLTLTAYDAGISGGSASVSYTAASGNTTTSIASSLASAVNASSSLSTAGITATSSGSVVHLSSTSQNLTTFAQSTNSGASETIYLALNMNGPQTVLVGGSATSGNVIGITVNDSTLSGGAELVTHTVGSGETPTSIASALSSAINSDSNLQAIGVSASSSGALITVKSLSTGVTSYVASRPSTATETLLVSLNPNGVETAAVGGSATAGDTVSITVYDAGLSGGSKTETYTVLSGDSPQSIASGLASVINGDSSLSSIGISATAVSAVINITSASINSTTYSKTLSGGATETLTLAYSTGNTQSTYNNLNELTATSGGGPTRFAGTTNKPIKSATVNSTAATLPTSTSFNASPVLNIGNNSTTVGATDGANNTVTNPYQVSVKGGPSATLTYDANGNMTSDGTNSYSWDAENRMIKITYPGSGNNSQFVYDGQGRNVSIVETVGGSTTSTKQFVWCGNKRYEARDASSAITAQYFSHGETLGGTVYFFAKDHLGSVHQMTNGTGTVQSQLAYDPFGR